MKKAVFLLVAGIVVCLAFAYGAEAQMVGQKGMMKGAGGGMMGGGLADCSCGMMQGGMGAMMPGCGMMQGRGMMGKGMMRGSHHRMMHICMNYLGLDAKQRQQIREIKLASLKDVIHKRADMQIAHLELRDLLAQDPVDMKAVAAKVKQIEGLRAGIQLALIKAKEEVKAKLTPEQRQKLMEMMGKSPVMGNADEEMGDTHEGAEEQAPAETKDEIQSEPEEMEQ
jgi:Spy/CpxP family protein refolding chaperone